MRLFGVFVTIAVLSIAAAAQSPKPTQPAARPAAAKPDANLLQLMRGTLYPASNVLFAAQEDPAKQPQPADASTSPNPLTTTYGGWPAVENAGLAIAETSRLLLVPGRVCSNGRPAPITRPDWIKFTADLRKAGLAAYEAAKKKSTDAMGDVSGTVSDACQACHDKYREKKERCL